LLKFDRSAMTAKFFVCNGDAIFVDVFYGSTHKCATVNDAHCCVIRPAGQTDLAGKGSSCRLEGGGGFE
jgi:hypothetical protein